jgi:hypothetical protein
MTDRRASEQCRARWRTRTSPRLPDCDLQRTIADLPTFTAYRLDDVELSSCPVWGASVAGADRLGPHARGRARGGAHAREARRPRPGYDGWWAGDNQPPLDPTAMRGARATAHQVAGC